VNEVILAEDPTEHALTY